MLTNNLYGAGIRSIRISGNTVSGDFGGGDEDYSMTVVGY